jgi:hypothetical protein
MQKRLNLQMTSGKTILELENFTNSNLQKITLIFPFIEAQFDSLCHV